MKTMWILLMCVFVLYGCQTPYSGTLGPDNFNGWVESEADGFICLFNGFDRICVLTIEGPAGKDGVDGKDGRDGETLIAVREVELEVIVREIVEIKTTEYVDREVLVPIVEERIVVEYRDREVPIEVFVTETIRIIEEVIVEKPTLVEVPGETVYVEVPVPEIVYVIQDKYIYDGCTPFYQHLPPEEQPCDVKG